MDWDRIWVELGGLAWEIARPLLVVLVTAILVQLAAKLGISLTADRQAQLEREVEAAIRRGEELRANGTLTPHTDILGWVTSEVQRLRPKVDARVIEDLVHATLPKLGLGAAAKATAPLR
jgi:predicted transcriptional regulator